MALYDDPMLAFEGLLTFLKAHKFLRNGDAFGHIIVVDCSQGVRETYLELWMPFTAFAEK